MDWPFVEGARATSFGAESSGQSRGTSIATATNSKPGTPTQLIASTPFDAHGVSIQITDQTTLTSALVDIMIGASTTERVLIPDLLASVATGAESQVAYYFPIFVPKGARISARAAVSAATTIRVCGQLHQANGWGATPFARVTAYGAVVGSSRGTNIDPGAVANTKSTPTVLAASTSDPIRLMTVAVGQAGDFARTPAGQALMDVMRGAASSEWSVVENLGISFGTSKDAWGPSVPLSNVPLYVPRGSRLSARGQCNITTAGDRLWDTIVYGVH